jgi:uncharacterized protein (TIGR02145 family)
MKRILLFFSVVMIGVMHVFAQVAINVNYSPPDPSAGLDIDHNTKGFLPPRVTFQQRNNILRPVAGLMVFCTNCKSDGTETISIFQGKDWLNLCCLICDVPNTPPAGIHVPTAQSITWRWNKVPIATGYKWNTTNNFATAIDIGADTSTTETGLNCLTSYTRYLWAYNACGNSGPRSLMQTTSPITFATSPPAGTHIAGFSFVTWNWNPVPGVIGYKWSTINDFNTAVNLGAANSNTEINLSCGTTFIRYLWAYDVCGYSLPTVLTQTTEPCSSCGTSLIDVRDGAAYNTVLIGTQCWFAQNINMGKKISGAILQSNNGTIEKYCYDNLEDNCSVYGGLYTWAEAVQFLNGATNSTSWDPIPSGYVTGICPNGWHLPDDDDWNNLTSYLGGLTVTGGKMKDVSWLWDYPNTGATNESGFTGLPAGYAIGYGGNNFYSLHSNTWYWSATQINSTGVNALILNYNDAQVDFYPHFKPAGYSVRCCKD